MIRKAPFDFGHLCVSQRRQRLRIGGDAIPEVFGKLDALLGVLRIQGIREAISGSNIRIIDVRTDDTDDVRAKANALYDDMAATMGVNTVRTKLLAFALGRRVAYLWCPGGSIRSRIWEAVAAALGDAVTTRNWATMTRLSALASRP